MQTFSPLKSNKETGRCHTGTWWVFPFWNASRMSQVPKRSFSKGIGMSFRLCVFLRWSTLVTFQRLVSFLTLFLSDLVLTSRLVLYQMLTELLFDCKFMLCGACFSFRNRKLALAIKNVFEGNAMICGRSYVNKNDTD